MSQCPMNDLRLKEQEDTADSRGVAAAQGGCRLLLEATRHADDTTNVLEQNGSKPLWPIVEKQLDDFYQAWSEAPLEPEINDYLEAANGDNSFRHLLLISLATSFGCATSSRTKFGNVACDESNAVTSTHPSKRFETIFDRRAGLVGRDCQLPLRKTKGK